MILSDVLNQGPEETAEFECHTVFFVHKSTVSSASVRTHLTIILPATGYCQTTEVRLLYLK